MNNNKFKLVLYPPIDKNGVAIKPALHEDLHTLHLKHYPEFIWYVWGLLIVAAIFTLALLLHSWILFLSLILLAVMIDNVFRERAIYCTINKETGSIYYHLSGVLMSSFGEIENNYHVSGVKYLEMHQQYRRWLWTPIDTFQIYLSLDDGQRLPLSSRSLDFNECFTYSKKIQDFLGESVPLKAVG